MTAKRGFRGAVIRSFGARDHEATVTGTDAAALRVLGIWAATREFSAPAGLSSATGGV